MDKIRKRLKRKAHIRKNLSGTAKKPRMVVYRSNKHISVQIVNDEQSKTLVAANDLKINNGTPIEKAASVGKEIALAAKKKKITTVVFDRNGYKFHGRVKALAEAAREGGLDF